MSTALLIKSLKAYTRFPSHVHGPAHWARVHRFGVLLAEREQLPAVGRICVEVFAWTHDLAREDDDGGNQHAIDGAATLDEVVRPLFSSIDSAQTEIVRAAIRYHSDGMTAGAAYDDGVLDKLLGPRELVVPIIGCCWDADRLDLPRVGVYPRADLMSTSAWREVLPLSEQVHKSVRDDSTYSLPTTYNPTLGARLQKPAGAPESASAPSIIEIRAPSRRRGHSG